MRKVVTVVRTAARAVVVVALRDADVDVVAGRRGALVATAVVGAAVVGATVMGAAVVVGDSVDGVVVVSLAALVGGTSVLVVVDDAAVIKREGRDDPRPATAKLTPATSTAATAIATATIQRARTVDTSACTPETPKPLFRNAAERTP